MRDTVLNKLIDDFNELPFEDREYALDLIQKQLVEAKRDAILRRAKEAQSNVKKGRVKKGSVQELMKDLESD
ncbi:MAG: hypothetical protein ABSB94_06930 [Syntrophorhabdales bacterium]|jgi:hypothetical protein